VEVDQRNLALHRESQADIPMVPRISPAVLIPKQAILAKRVIVRARLAFDYATVVMLSGISRGSPGDTVIVAIACGDSACYSPHVVRRLFDRCGEYGL
jgi:hypothetical protein